MTSALLTPPADARDVFITVNAPRLITEIGALFSSPSAALAEVVQNAYRAGATRLDITWDAATRVITFTDDGRGLASLDVLLQIAESGWDRADVVDAAGMGAFALLALAESVQITSYPRNGTPFQAQFDATIFSGGGAKSWTVPTLNPRHAAELTDSEDSGTSMRVTLKPDVHLPALDTAGRWRHRFPITVTTNGVVVPAATLPIGLDAAAIVTVPGIGQLALAPSLTFSTPSVVEWEHRLLAGQKISGRISEALLRVAATRPAITKDLATDLANGVAARTMHWVIDPSSGVRPKLPDRETLIENAALAGALTAFAEALLDTLDITRILADADAASVRPTKHPAQSCYTASELTDGFWAIAQGAAFGALLAPTRQRLRAVTIAGLSGLIATARSVTSDFDADNVHWERGDEGHRYPLTPSAAETVFVRPAYQIDQESVAAAAVAAGSLAVTSHDTAPKTYLRADAWILVPENGAVVTPNLRLVTAAGDLICFITETIMLGDPGCSGELALDAVWPEDRAAAAAAQSAAEGERDADDGALGTVLIDALIPATAEELTYYILNDPSYARYEFAVQNDTGGLTYDGDDEFFDLQPDLERALETIMRAVVGEDVAMRLTHERLRRDIAQSVRGLAMTGEQILRDIEAAHAVGCTSPALQVLATRLQEIVALRDEITAATLLAKTA